MRAIASARTRAADEQQHHPNHQGGNHPATMRMRRTSMAAFLDAA